MFLWLSKRNLKTVACNSASIYGLLVESQPRTWAFFLLQFSVIFFLPPFTIHSTKQNFCYVPLNFMKNSSWWKVQAGNSNDSVTFLSHADNAGCFFAQRTQFLLLSAFFSFNKQMSKVITSFEIKIVGWWVREDVRDLWNISGHRSVTFCEMFWSETNKDETLKIFSKRKQTEITFWTIIESIYIERQKYIRKHFRF